MRALDDMLQITDHISLPEGRMDGVIVAVAHDEFRGWGFRACGSFWMRGRGGSMWGAIDGEEVEEKGFLVGIVRAKVFVSLQHL